MRTADALDRVTQRSRDAGGDGAETAESAHELREVLQDLATLYNDYAARYQVLLLLLRCPSRQAARERPIGFAVTVFLTAAQH
jgi:hypothetical protein